MSDAWPELDVGDVVSPRDECIILSFKAGATISKGDPVYLIDHETVAPATSPQNCIGIAVENAEAGRYVPVCVLGIVKVVAGEPIERGQAVYAADSEKRILALPDCTIGGSGGSTYTIYYARRLGIAIDRFAGAGDKGRILVIK